MILRRFVFIGSLWCLVLFSLSNCKETAYPQGKAIYEYKCANCHMPNGEGLIGNIPPLNNSSWIKDNLSDVACIIRYGQHKKIVVNGLDFHGKMAGFPKLSDTEIANVVNYLLTEFNEDIGPRKPTEIIKDLEKCKGRTLIKEANPQQL